MQGTPDQNRRDPSWLWPVVGAVGLILFVVLAIIANSRPGSVTPAAGAQGAVVWVGAAVTIMLYSILYRENPYYRFAEHVFLGLAAGYGVYVIWKTNLFQNWYVPLFIEGQWLWTLAPVCCLMYFTVYNRRLSWMSRIVMLMLLAFNSGLYFRLWAGEWVAQVGDSFRPLLTRPAPYVVFGQELFSAPHIQFDNLVFVITLLAVMTYFLFSFEQKGRFMRGTATGGRWLMMIAFGAMFGSTVMARMSLFIGRLSFLFQDWIHLIPKN